MNYCEYTTNRVSDGKEFICGKPASTKINGKWYCEEHADVYPLLNNTRCGACGWSWEYCICETRGSDLMVF